jgi:hypothetical protein
MIGKIIIQVKISLDGLVGIAKLLAGRPGDRIPVGATFFTSVQTGRGPTQPYIQCVPWVKRRGGCFDHPSASSAEVEDKV